MVLTHPWCCCWWWLLPLLATASARSPVRDTASVLQDLDKDLDRLMEDERLFKEYYQCLLDLGPCNEDTTNFKDVVQEALERGCARCSPSQHKEAVSLLRTVMECRPREFAEIERQFDPKGNFRGKYQLYKGAIPFFRGDEIEEEICGGRWGK